MRRTILILFYCFFYSCRNDYVKDVDIRTSNTIPWDTLGSTMEGKKIKWTDTKEFGRPNNDSILRRNIESCLNRNGFKDFLKNNIITFLVQVDTSGHLNNIVLHIYPDTTSENKIKNLLFPLLKNSEPWIAPTNYYNKTKNGRGILRLTHMTVSQEIELNK